MSVGNHVLRRILRNRVLDYWLSFEINFASRFNLSLLILNSILFTRHLGTYSCIRIIISCIDNLSPCGIQISKIQLLFNIMQCLEVLYFTKLTEKIVKFYFHSLTNLIHLLSLFNWIWFNQFFTRISELYIILFWVIE